MVAPSSALTQLSEELGTLNAEAAKCFLALAAVLQANSECARKVTGASHKAIGSHAAAQTGESIEMLQRVLKGATGTTSMADLSIERMSTILAHMAASATALERLGKTRSLLHTLSILSRIEGSRLDSGTVDVTGLSRDIETLGNEMQQHLDSVQSDSTMLQRLLTEGIAMLAAFDRQQQAASSDLVSRTHSLLGPAVARVEVSRAAARSVEEQFLGFLRSTDTIVMSLQSEDLARQRIEHIQTALLSSAQALDAGSPLASVAASLILQRAQLVSTRDLLHDAIESLQAGLLAVEPQVQQLVNRTVELTHQTMQDRNAFITLVDDSNHAIRDVFESCQTAARSAHSTVEEATASVQNMIRGASALGRIQTEVRYLSINAIIKTGQLGSGGASMSVLATEMQQMARMSDADTAIILEQLAAIKRVAAAITNESEASGGSFELSGEGARKVQSQLSELSALMRATSREMDEGLAEVQEHAMELCGEVRKSFELATQAKTIIPIFEEQLASFDRFFEQFGITVGLAQSYAQDHQGDELSGLYSMESERKLHIGIFGGPAEASLSSGSTSEFGDDVELF